MTRYRLYRSGLPLLLVAAISGVNAGASERNRSSAVEGRRSTEGRVVSTKAASESGADPDFWMMDCATDDGSEPSSSCAGFFWGAPDAKLLNFDDGTDRPTLPMEPGWNRLVMTVRNRGGNGSNPTSDTKARAFAYFQKAAAGMEWAGTAERIPNAEGSYLCELEPSLCNLVPDNNYVEHNVLAGGAETYEWAWRVPDAVLNPGEHYCVGFVIHPVTELDGNPGHGFDNQTSFQAVPDNNVAQINIQELYARASGVAAVAARDSAGLFNTKLRAWNTTGAATAIGFSIDTTGLPPGWSASWSPTGPQAVPNDSFFVVDLTITAPAMAPHADSAVLDFKTFKVTAPGVILGGVRVIPHIDNRMPAAVTDLRAYCGPLDSVCCPPWLAPYCDSLSTLGYYAPLEWSIPTLDTMGTAERIRFFYVCRSTDSNVTLADKIDSVAFDLSLIDSGFQYIDLRPIPFPIKRWYYRIYAVDGARNISPLGNVIYFRFPCVAGCSPTALENPYPADGKLAVGAFTKLAWNSAMCTVALDADIDSKPLDVPIGTGGASVGEPVSVGAGATAIVRSGPMGSPSLELADNSTCCADGARFEFLNSEEYEYGRLIIQADLWFDQLDGYYLYVREQGTSARNFTNMHFSGSGHVSINDENGSNPLVGSYTTGRRIPLLIVFDLSAGTYNLWLDGVQLVWDRAHGVTGAGVGAVLVGTLHDADLTGRFHVDNLLVTRDRPCITCMTVYDVKFGTASPPAGVMCSRSSVPLCDPGPLAFATTYYWQVVARNGFYSETGPVWSFTTENPPGQPCIDVQPRFIDICTPTGGTGCLDLVVSNDCGGILSYNVVVTTDEGGHLRLSLNGGSAYSGTIPAGSPPEVIQLCYDATGLAAGFGWNWRLEVTSNVPENDPGQGGVPIDIQVGAYIDFLGGFCGCDRPGTPQALTPADGAVGVDPGTHLLWAASSRAEMLQAHFNAEPLGQPIGTGGAANGQPVSVSSAVSAIVETDGPRRVLEIGDNASGGVEFGHVAFELLGDSEIDRGVLTTRAVVKFTGLDDYVIQLMEQGPNPTKDFASLEFDRLGWVSYSDASGGQPLLQMYDTDRWYELVIVADLEQRTNDVWLDGERIIQGESHGIDDRGIGHINLGYFVPDVDLDGTLSVDELTVDWSENCAPVYTVYLDQTDPPATAACENLAAPICQPPALEGSKTYYWRVREVTAAGEVLGPVWSFTTAATGGVDSDGDGLLDEWEISGYDADGDGTIDVDLPALGADPLHKDLFVEVDWMMAGPGETESHQFKDRAREIAVAMFAAAPVPNPDGIPGINLHVDVGQGGAFTGGNAIPHDDDLNPVWTDFDNIKSAHFDPRRDRVFRYCVFAHKHSGGTSSGVARGIPATDFVVSLGGWGSNPGTVWQQAGTFVHELGHGLGLGHGGGDHSNRKPNYLSVMSYHFQMAGLVRGGGATAGNFDYSRWDLPDLDEDALMEPVGLSGPPELDDYCTRHYADPGTGCVGPQVCNVNGPIDWNADGSISVAPVAHDIGGSNCWCCGNRSVLESFDDWANLIYWPGLSLRSGGLQDTVIEELTWEEHVSRDAIQGDANGDKLHTASDIILIVNYVFKGGPPANPAYAADVNCNQVITSADIIWLVNFVFKGGRYPCSS